MAPLLPIPYGKFGYVVGGLVRTSTTTGTNYDYGYGPVTATYTNYPIYTEEQVPEPVPETKADRQRRKMALHLKRLEIGSYAQAKPSLPDYQPPDPRRVYLLRTFRRCSRRDQSQNKKAPVG